MTGCADDGPAYHAAPRRIVSASRRVLPSRQDVLGPQTLHAPDALETADALDGGNASAGPISLTPDTADAPAPQYDDALASPDALAGGASGRAMPTEHSHWLKGNIFNARVTVRLNGLFLGTYAAPQDRDITMKLRAGMNTIALTYQPLTPTASAHLDVLESEHNPPIAPLATFRSPNVLLGQSSPPTTTETLTFLAR